MSAVSLFIHSDTEGNFVMERVAEIAGAAVAHIQSVAESSKDAGKQNSVQK